MQATSNGFHAEYDAMDWQAALDYANDQTRHPWPPRDQRTPCQNVACDQLCESLYCSEACREQTEGPDHEIEDERPLAAPAPLPEAPVSMNVHIPVCGRDVLVTLRGVDEAAVLARLERLLQRYPMEPPRPPVSPGVDWCALHQELMHINTKEGRTWYSHKTAEGWCKGVKHAR